MIHIDFETYSSAGYGPDFKPLRKGKSGIEIVGSARYAEDPSTRPLSLAYKIGTGPTQLWIDGMPPPQDLIDAVRSGEHVAAWNSSFEYDIWPKLGIGRIPLSQFVDPSALARAYGIPGSLAKAGAVLKLTHEKLEDGKRLINKFSVPPGRDPRLDPVDGRKFYEYNIRDVDAEAEAMSKLPPLIPFEQRVWELDQRINDRGVHIDVPALNRLISLYELESAKYTKELQDITGGEVSSGSEVAKMLDWLKLGLANLDAENVERALKFPDLTAAQKRVLELRQLLSLSSCKKLYAIHDRLCKDSRIRWLFQYYGAGTGRWAGRGPQPQNLTAGDPDAADAFLRGGPPGPDIMGSISGALRGLFIPAPGCDFLCSDYSAIEAVVLACLAGEQWRIDVFKTHGKIYEMSASKITGIPFDEFLRVKRETGEHHPMRKKVGKVAELACFGPDTEILTNNGYKKIPDVIVTDKLWDGIQWVNHCGVVKKGEKETLFLDGIRVTPEHPISLGRSWTVAKKLALNQNTLDLALAIGSENLPLSVMGNETEHGGQQSSAHAAGLRISSFTQHCTSEKQPVAENVVEKKRVKRILNCIQHMQTLCQIMKIGVDSLTGYGLQYQDATLLAVGDMRTMGGEASMSAMSGVKKMEQGRSSCMPANYRGIITKSSKWIVLTLIKDTLQVILDLLQDQKTSTIKDQFQKCKNESTSLSVVYDIVNAGPLHRFTIRTNSGHLIVHNSGYQGGYGAWLAFGADKHLSEQEIRDAIKAWRAASQNIVQYWYKIEDCAKLAVQYPGNCFEYRGIKFQCANDILHVRLLSGRILYYHNPRLHQELTPWGKEVSKLTFMGNGKFGWDRIDTYGGKLTENIVQATARDILANALLNLDAAGYMTVLHVHDEICAEVPEGWGSIDEMEKLMGALPDWCKDWPIRAAGGWRGKRYKKEA